MSDHPTLGYAVLPVIPSMRGVQATMDRQLGAIVGPVGAKAGASMGSKMGQSMSKAVGAATKLAAKLAATGFTLAAAGVAVIGVKALKSGLALTEMEQRARASETAILGSREAANQLADAVDKFSPSTVFPREVFVQAAQQMVQLGFAAKDVVPDLKAISDAVSATGGGANQIDAITKVLERIQVTGKITTRDFRQLGTAGVNAAQIIGLSLGKTGDQIRSEITSGTLSADKAVTALVDGMEKKFHSSAGNLANTFAGAKMRVQSLLTDIGAELTQPFVSNTTGGLGATWLRGLGDGLQKLDTSVVPKLAEDFSHAATAAGHLAHEINLGHIGSELKGLIPVASGAAAALLTLGSHSLPFGLGEAASALNPMVAGMSALALAIPASRREIGRLISDVTPLTVELGQHLLPILHDAQTVAGEVLPPALAATRIAMKLALDVAIPLADGVGTITHFLAAQPEILAAVAAGWGGYALAQGIAAGTTAGFVASEDASTIAILANKAAALGSTITTAALTVAGAAQAVVVDGLAASFVALATAEVSATVAAGGIAAGIGGGAVLAITTLNHEAEKGKTAAQEFVKSLDIDPSNLKSVSQGVSLIQEQIAKVDSKAHEGYWKGLWSEGTKDSQHQAIVFQNTLADMQHALEKGSHNQVRNLESVAHTTGLATSQVYKLAQGFGVDLTGSFNKSKTNRAQLRDDMVKLMGDAKTAGIRLNDAIKMDPKQVAADAKAIQQVQQQVRSAWTSFADVTQLKNEPVDPKSLKQAEQAVTDAQTRVDRARSATGQKEVTNAETRLAIAEREASAHHKTAAEAQKAADALASARQNLTDVRDSSANSVDDAAQNLTQAKQALADLKATDSPLDGRKIEDFYRTTLATARTFQANVKTAVQDGFDPQLVQRLVQEGPQQAGPILQALVANSTASFVQTVNAGETELQRMTDAAVVQATRFAQLQQKAVDAGTGAAGQRLATELPEAMRIAQAAMGATASTTITDIAKTAGVSVAQVKAIAKDFGIQLDGLKKSAADLSGQALKDYVLAVDYLKRTHDAALIMAAIETGSAAVHNRNDPTHRAMGGPVEAGVAYMVGEHRPEVFVPDHAGRIVPSVPQWVASLPGASAPVPSSDMGERRRRREPVRDVHVHVNEAPLSALERSILWAT